MKKKIYIRKETVDLRIMVFIIGMVVIGNLLFSLRNNYLQVSVQTRIAFSILFLFCVWVVILYIAMRKNSITRTGRLIWCKVDRSRCENNGAGIVIRAGYFWEDDKQFVEYTGSIRTALDSRRDEYAQMMEKVKYVPVFVDVLDRNKYAMVLCDFWLSQEEVVKRGKDVIRIIDNCLYEKESVNLFEKKDCL